MLSASTRDGPRGSGHEAIRGGAASAAHPFNTYASPTPVIERWARLRHVRIAGHGLHRYEELQGSLGAPRHRVQPFSRRRFVADHLSQPADHAFRRQRPSVRRRAGQTDRQDGLDDEASIDFKDVDANGKIAADGDFRKAFATPHVAMIDGRWELISLGAKAAYSYDPLTGKELWRVEEREQHSASTRPVIGHGMIFFPTGFSTGQLFAVRTGGNGLITDTHVVWKIKRAVSNKPSILLIDDLIYMIDDKGIASCVEAKTGELVWQKRIGGEYSASPVYADGKIWLFSEDGKTTVIRPGRTFEALAENQLDDGFLASPPSQTRRSTCEPERIFTE